MNIILGKENIRGLDSKYLVLELDTMRFGNSADPVTAYCLIENLPINEMLTLDQYSDLHENLIRNYRLKNWNYCINAIEHLKGKWHGEVDSFYQDLLQRITAIQDQELDDAWYGYLIR